MQSLDLLPTSIGVLYALTGAVAVCAAVVTFAIGVADPADRRAHEARSAIRYAFGRSGSLRGGAGNRDGAGRGRFRRAYRRLKRGLAESLDEALGAEDESPINFNRSGHLPSLEAIETVLETPEEPHGPPSLIGSYSSAGANYKIFSDGSIEAETGEGTFQFASMSDFKRHLTETKAKTASE